MKSVINIGVLGCANIATRSVIPAILELSDYYNLLGLASRSLEKAEECAHNFRTKAYEGYQTLLDVKDLHAIYIPLPNSLHTEWIEKALNKGLHVLVEKSLACEYEEVIRLNNLAKQKGLTLIENFQFRFHSQLTYIKKMIDNDIIGELRCLRSSFGFPGLPTEDDIRLQSELGGGALMDTGAYPLKIAQIFMGYEIEVKAASLNTIPGKEVDIWGGAYVKQINGNLFGELAFGFNNFYQCNIELWGTKGKIYTNRIFTANINHVPVIELETQSVKETIVLTTDHPFENMLIHFYHTISSKSCIEDEYLQNINQARLINEIKYNAKQQ